MQLIFILSGWFELPCFNFATKLWKFAARPWKLCKYTCSRNNNTVHELLRKSSSIVTTISWINTKRVADSQQSRASSIFKNPGPNSKASSAISANNLLIFEEKELPRLQAIYRWRSFAIRSRISKYTRCSRAVVLKWGTRAQMIGECPG